MNIFMTQVHVAHLDRDEKAGQRRASGQKRRVKEPGVAWGPWERETVVDF